MTAATSTSRLYSTVQPSTEPGFLDASQVASALKGRWQRGEPPDIAGALENHPQLRHYRSVVLDLAYCEFKLRLQEGEDLDADEFSQRFPSFQRSLCLLIGMHELLSHDPDFQALQGMLPWPEPGSRFLQFDLIAELGRGTFGRVFLATEPSLGERQVALKVAPHGGEEADILGRLRHPNIVPIYSVQEDVTTGLAAFCMPYLGRTTLCDVLDQAFAESRVPTKARTILNAVERNSDSDLRESAPADAILRKGSYVDGVLHLGVQLADALAYAHGRGIYHRDLKPSNVLMTTEARPLLLDFNLSVDSRLLTERIGGTVPYMAPEELTAIFEKPTASRQRHYDPRSDIFSLGVILYELLTGTLPFGEIPWKLSVEEVACQLHQRQKHGPTPIGKYNGHVDGRVSRLIESCLAFEPEKRPETASELTAALRSELAPIRRATRWIGNHRRLVGSAATLAFALVAAVSLFLALRPPYAVRQLERGIAFDRAGQYTLAVDCLNDAVRANPTCGEALFSRGRTYQHLGDFRMAYQDYSAAYRLTRHSLYKACEGHCLNRINSHKAAIAAYRLALDGGYESPALLYNNMGFSYRILRQIDEAESCLRSAIRIDDRLQAVHYNIVMTALQRALHQPGRIPDTAFLHATKAIELGPPSPDLYQGIAALYATAAKQDRRLIPPTIEYVGKAVELGARPEAFASDVTYSALHTEAAFRHALKKSVSTSSPSKAIQLLDPIETP